MEYEGCERRHSYHLAYRWMTKLRVWGMKGSKSERSEEEAWKGAVKMRVDSRSAGEIILDPL